MRKKDLSETCVYYILFEGGRNQVAPDPDPATTGMMKDADGQISVPSA
jgi:hypothetical protein